MSKTINMILGIVMGITGLLAYAASKFTSGQTAVIITAGGLLGFIISLIVLAFRLKNLKSILKAVGLSLVAVIIGTYLILFVFVYFFQDTVANQTSSFFQPKTISIEKAQVLTASDVLPIDLATADGIHLRGWLVRNSTESKSPLVIYFGGSGSESSEIIPFARKLKGWSVALINYRGFGLSEGTPTHADALSDALFIFDSLSTREDINPKQVAVMGYSLGSGIATYLSEQRPTIGTVLVSPYDQWTLIGLKRTPLYTPLSRIMKPYFDSFSRAPGIHTPLLCLIGSEDIFIPPERSKKLVDAWGGETNLILYPGADHELLFHDNDSWSEILEFLKDLES